jgi:hypothetical protein
MVRSVLSILAGVVVAVMVVGVVEVIGQLIFPPPPGINATDPNVLRAIIATLPFGAIAFVLLAWGLGSLAGGFTAAVLSRRARMVPAAIVGCIQMAFGIVTMFMFPTVMVCHRLLRHRGSFCPTRRLPRRTRSPFPFHRPAALRHAPEEHGMLSE